MQSLNLKIWKFLIILIFTALFVSAVKANNIPTLESLGVEKPPTFIEIEKTLNTEDKRWVLFYHTADSQAYINVKSVSYQPITKLPNSTGNDYLVIFSFIAYQPKTYRYMISKLSINCAIHTMTGNDAKLLKLTGEVLDFEPFLDKPIKPNSVWENAEKFVCPFKN